MLYEVITIITGPELDAMDDAELRRRIATACVFARAVPEQKLRIVRALKDNGEVVAMTGDGVNDARITSYNVCYTKLLRDDEFVAFADRCYGHGFLLGYTYRYYCRSL